MRTTKIRFERNEKHMLLGLLASMYQASQSTEDKGAAWVLIGQKLRADDSQLNEDEAHLLKLAVDSTIAAGDRMLGRLPEDDVAARLRAGVVKQTYITIKGKIDDAKWTEDELCKEPQDLRGNDEGRQEPEDHAVHLSGGGAIPPGASD